MAITVNLNVLDNCTTELPKLAEYYFNKTSSFAKTSSAQLLNNVLADIHSNYQEIGTNISTLSRYLIHYYNDINSLERKMSQSGGGSFTDSTVSSIVSKYSNSITNATISYDKIFDNIQAVDFAQTEVSKENLMNTFPYSNEKASAMLLLSNSNQNLNEEEINFLTAYYNNEYELQRQKFTTSVTLARKEYDRIDKIENILKGYGYDFESLERAIKTAEMTGDEQEVKRLQKLLKDTGYTSKEEYDKALEEAKKKFQAQDATLHSVEQTLKTLPYTFQVRDVNYQNFQSTASISKENLKEFLDPNYSYIDYKGYCKKYGEVDPYTFCKVVKEEFPHADITGLKNESLYTRLVEASSLEPELAKFFLYSYETKGKDAAYKYLEDMEEQINMHCAELNANEFLDSLVNLNDEETRLWAIANHLQVTGKALVIDGTSNFAKNIGYAIEGLFTGKENRVYSVQDYESMFLVQAFSSEEAKLKAGLITRGADGKLVSSSNVIDYTADYGKLLDHNYQISQSIGNMLPSIAISTVCPLAGKISFGLSAGGGSYHSAMVEGYSKDQALVHGAFNGLSEVLTEYFLGGIPGLSDVQITSAKTFLQASFKEGVEEFIQTYTNAGSEVVVLNKVIDSDELRAEAYTSAIYGMISAGVLNGVRTSINASLNHMAMNSGITTEQDLQNEYKNFVRDQMTDLAQEGNKNVSHGKVGSLLAGLGTFGANIFGGNSGDSSNSSTSTSTETHQGSTNSEYESLQSRKSQLLKDNPKLSEIETQRENGERIVVPKSLSEQFNELANINARLNLLSQQGKVSSDYTSKASPMTSIKSAFASIGESFSSIFQKITQAQKVNSNVESNQAANELDSLYMKALHEYEDILNQNPDLYKDLQKYYAKQKVDFSGNTKLQEQFMKLVNLNNQLYSLQVLMEENNVHSQQITPEMINNAVTSTISDTETANAVIEKLKKIYKQNPNKIALLFSDPKQYIISKFPELAVRHAGSANFYNDFISYIYTSHELSVQEISFNDIYSTFSKYLDANERATLNNIINDRNSAYNNLSEIQKKAMSLYAYATGPVLTAALRKCVIFFSNGKGDGVYYDGTNPEFVANALRDGFNLWSVNRDNLSNVSKFKSQLSNVDSFTNIMDSLFQTSPTLKEDITVYRVVDGLYKDGNKISTFDIGTIFNDDAYLSTQLVDGSFGENDFTKIKLKIEIPKGTQAAYIEQFTGVKNYSQQELLLNRGTSLQVTGDFYFDENNQLVLPVKVVNPEFSRMGIDNIKNINSNLDYFNEYYSKGQLSQQVDLADMVSYMKAKGLNLEYERQIQFLKNNHVYDNVTLAEHGFNHVRNVLMYAMYMGNNMNLNSQEMKVLTAATALHDSGLNFTSHENGHGLKGAENVQKFLDSNYSKGELQMIQAAIELHEIPDEDIKRIEDVHRKYGFDGKNLEELTKITNILKDADALDRTRFPGNLKLKYFRTDVSKSMVQASYQMQDIRANQFLQSKIDSHAYDSKVLEITRDGKSYKIPALDIINEMRNNNVSDYLIYMYLENNWHTGTHKKLFQIFNRKE